MKVICSFLSDSSQVTHYLAPYKLILAFSHQQIFISFNFGHKGHTRPKNLFSSYAKIIKKSVYSGRVLQSGDSSQAANIVL